MTSFSAETLEVFLLVLVRISAFVSAAPFFSQKSVPMKIKAGLSFVISVLIFETIGEIELSYVGTIGYAVLIVREAICGLLLGLAGSICIMILALAGNIIDMEIGFSMAQGLDPATNVQTTISGNLYTYFVMLIMLITDVHLYIVSAIVESFEHIKLGQVNIRFDMYTLFADFIQSYFVTAFRIVLPVFAITLMINVVLGVLAKVASQMNLFVIGIQLKIIVGLVVLIFIAGLLPAISNFIFNEMKELMREFVKFMM